MTIECCVSLAVSYSHHLLTSRCHCQLRLLLLLQMTVSCVLCLFIIYCSLSLPTVRCTDAAVFGRYVTYPLLGSCS